MENSALIQAQIYCETYFANLPEELIVEILRYVSMSDVWNFCEAFKHIDHLLREKAFTRNINLKALYDVNTSRVFVDINPENVTYLNLNYCHWLPHEDLLRFVGNCTNLKTLLALGTKLELSDEDVKSYHKTKITKLAVTIKTQTLAMTSAVLDKVASLALEIECMMFYNCTPAQFTRIFPSVQKVWVNDILSFFDDVWLCEWLNNMYSSSGQFPKLAYYPLRRRRNLYNIIMFPYNENTNNRRLPLLPAESVQFEKPYGRKVAKLLHSGEKTLETIQFEELDLYQSYLHNEKCDKEFQQLLMSPNARNIDKLTLCICLIDKCESSTNSESDSCILEKFNNLQFLRLYNCYGLRALQACKSLANLTKLRYLLVEIPRNNDGSFLFDVLHKCPQLETLHIDNVHNSNENVDIIHRHIFEGLKYSKSLKELILENFDFLCIDDLLSILIRSNTIKLETLSLSCKFTRRSDQNAHNSPFNDYLCRKPDLECFNLELLAKYLRFNPQLTVCQIYIATLQNEQIHFIQQQMCRFKRPYRLFDIGLSGLTFNKPTLSRFNLMNDIGSF